MFIDFLMDIFREAQDRQALIYNEKDYSYNWLLENIEKWDIFIKKQNISFNSVVSIRSDFNPDSVCLMLSLIKNAAILVPLSPVVKDPDKMESIAQVEHSIDLTKKEISVENKKIKVDHSLLLALKEKKHPGLILFSSGTTGEPKAALHDLVPLLQKFKKRRKPFKTITFLLFDHIGGFNTLFYILSNAGTIVAIHERSAENVCRLIEKYEIELLPTSPTFINMILFSKTYEKYDISSLKVVTYGTEPMPESTLLTFNRIFPQITLKQTYGLSEIGIMRSKSESSDSLWLKVGGEDYTTKIVNDQLWIKAKTAMLGYLNAPSPFTKDGWFNTGDRVEIKGEYLRFLGRDSELINVGGEKVYPIEVESTLLEIEGVEDASVKGEKNLIMGNIVIAKIRVDEKNNNREFIKKIKKYCRKRLATFKVPVKIKLTSEKLNSDRFKRKR